MTEEINEDHVPGTSPAEMVDGGHWRPDGTFQAPEGWPEGAGWIVRDPDGTIARWGPASDLQLVASIDIGDEGPMPPAAELNARLLGAPILPGTEPPG